LPDRNTAEANQSNTATQAASVSAQAPQTAVSSLPATAIDLSYRLGSGDSIQVNFFNVPEYSGPQQVLADGTINMPAVGGVPVTGLTLAEAEQAIAARYSRELRNIRVTVSLTQARPLQIGVAGEVRQPGFYVMTSGDVQAPSVAQAIQAAGGATQLADLRQIQVRRTVQGGTSQTVTVDLWALLEEGDQSQNLALRDGDTIVIPPTTSMSAAQTEQLAASNLASNAPQSIGVSVVGEVGRPGAYRLDTAAGNRATLTQAIQAAGGITPEANLQNIEVQRTARNGTVQTTTLDLWQLVMSGDLSQDLILQTGDRITLAKAEAMTPEEMARLTSSSVAPSNIRINITGEATSPGSLQLPANTTLNQALLAAGGFNRRARDTVRLIRINPNGTLTQRSIEVDWERGIDPENNPILFNNDVILVGRSSLASFSDGASNLLEPFFRILPVFNLF
jgi:polysaccharide export outer membrane protein